MPSPDSPPRPPDRPREAGPRRAALVVAAAVMGSRLLGLVRELVFAALFGAGKYLDAYYAAFRIPNLLRDLFAEGALSTAFTTVFAKTWEEEGSARAWRLASLLVTAATLVLSLVCVAAVLAAPWIVWVTNPGFTNVPGKFELTVTLTRILFPFILFLSLAAVAMGILNARFVFGLPASASTAFNFVSVVSGVLLAYVFEPQADPWRPHFTDRALLGVCLGVLTGGVAQLAIQLPSLFRLGFRPGLSLDWGDSRLRQVGRLMVPSVIAGAAVQVNVLVNGVFASEIDGGISWLNCAFRLMQFPIGIFGVAIATATLPAVSRMAARRDMEGFGRTVDESLRFAFFLTIPAAAGLAALAAPIIGLVYEHGRFGASDTAQTALALQAYALGLAGYAAIKVLAPCFYALDRPNVPLRVSLLGIGGNVCFNLLLVKGLALGHAGLALSTSLLALVNVAQLAYALRREVAFGRAAEWARFLASVGAASLACWLAARWVHATLHVAFGGAPGPAPFARAGAVLPACLAGALVYFALAWLLRVAETRVALAKAREKIFGKRDAA